jgi:molybdopterin converting factor small subunit
MRITFQYSGQARQALGRSEEVAEVAEGVTVADALRAQAETASARSFLYTDAGELRPSLLVFVNEEQKARPAETILKDRDTVLVMAPLAGG